MANGPTSQEEEIDNSNVKPPVRHEAGYTEAYEHGEFRKHGLRGNVDTLNLQHLRMMLARRVQSYAGAQVGLAVLSFTAKDEAVSNRLAGGLDAALQGSRSFKD